MWAAHGDVHGVGSAGALPDMGGWHHGMETDYSSPMSAMSASPMGGDGSGMMSSFSGGAPMGGGAPAFAADAAAHACQLAPALVSQVQAIGSRVQKLERSRGQISKDLFDMLNETKDLKKKAGAPAALEEPSDAPPGLGRRGSRLKTAPAPALPKVPEEPEQPPSASKPATDKIPPPPGLALPVAAPPAPPVPDSLAVRVKEVDGVTVSRVEWRIDNVRAKFKDCVGRPLVSPQFEACGLDELRLMVFPNLGLDISGLTMREQKSRYEARIAEGPLSGALKFKVVTSFGDDLVVKFNLFVGENRQGPLEHNFADHIIHGADFDQNWLDQIKGGSLVVGVELLAVNGADKVGAKEAEATS